MTLLQPRKRLLFLSTPDLLIGLCAQTQAFPSPAVPSSTPSAQKITIYHPDSTSESHLLYDVSPRSQPWFGLVNFLDTN